MNILIISLFATSISFGLLAIFFSFHEEKTKKILHEAKKQLSQRLYELSILKHLSSEIGYSLNMKKVAEVIIFSVEKLLSSTCVSYAVIEQDKIVIKSFVKESCGEKYIQEAKKIILDSLYTIDQNTKQYKIVDSISGELTDLDSIFPLSFFNIPLIVRDNFVGIISVTSKNKKNYSTSDALVLYKLIDQATKTVEKLDEAIETEKSKLNSMLLSIPSGAIVFLLEKDDILRLSTINTAAKQFLHLDEDTDAIKVITSFGREFNLLKQIKTVLEEKHNIMIENVSLYDKTFKIFVNPVFLTKSKIIGASITMQDMTVEKQVQDIRENFTNMVVHELRAPLTSIKGSSELLISGTLSKSDETKMLQIIKLQSESLLSEIGELLDASKIDSGKFAVSKELSDLNKLINQKIEAFTFIADQKHIKISVNLDNNMPIFEFDRERIGQVLNNLLSNALKFTHENGTIEIQSIIQDDVAIVRLHDNGVGIPEQLQSTLFTKYAQAGSSTMRVKGTGLGLYISKSIIDSHGGKIWFDSSDNKGTTFYFTLPAIHPIEIPDQKDRFERAVN